MMSNDKNQPSKAPPPITPLRGTGSPFRTSSRRTTAKLPDWNYWKHMDEVAIWQACALALNIDPESMQGHSESWMHPEGDIFTEESFTSDEQADSFNRLSRRLRESLSNRQHFTPTSNRDVRLPEFAAWCMRIGSDIPPELATLAKAAQQADHAAAKGKAKSGRPKTIDKKIIAVRQMIVRFERAASISFEPRDLRGSAANLLDACQRFEKSNKIKPLEFSTSQETFNGWLKKAGYSFTTGRTLDAEKDYWTKLVVKVTV